MSHGRSRCCRLLLLGELLALLELLAPGGPAHAGEARPTVKALVARRKVQPWVLIKEPEKWFVVRAVPVRPGGEYLRSFDEIRGKRLNKYIHAGQCVTTKDLLKPEDMGGFHRWVGRRAVALTFPRDPNFSPAFAGARVDVWLHPPDPGVKGFPRVILRNMKVVETEDTLSKRQERLVRVTLEATPDQAAKFALAANEGRLRLVVRAPQPRPVP